MISHMFINIKCRYPSKKKKLVISVGWSAEDHHPAPPTTKTVMYREREKEHFVTYHKKLRWEKECLYIIILILSFNSYLLLVAAKTREHILGFLLQWPLLQSSDPPSFLHLLPPIAFRSLLPLLLDSLVFLHFHEKYFDTICFTSFFVISVWNFDTMFWCKIIIVVV